MLVNPYTGVVNSALSGGKSPVNRVQKAVQQLSSGDRITKAADDVAGLSIATNLQNKVTGLRAALTNTSLFTSLAQTADAGVGQIQTLINRAQQLATQANSGVVNDDNREALDLELQSVLQEITRVAEGTSFNDVNLLDGSLTGDEALDINSALGEGDETEGSTLSVESLTASSLLGELSITTQEGAQAALTALQQAQNNVGTARASIGAFSEQIDFAAAHVETAIANQEAARSSLSDADFAAAATELSQASLQRDLEVAVQAQSKRLPPSMLELLQS